MPFRVQLRRTAGWRLPPNTVSVARPSRWGNPFRVGDHLADGTEIVDNLHAVRLFTDWLTSQPDLVEEAGRELRGKNVACACAHDEACHGDVWLRVANRDGVVSPGVRRPASLWTQNAKVIA